MIGGVCIAYVYEVTAIQRKNIDAGICAPFLKQSTLIYATTYNYVKMKRKKNTQKCNIKYE